MYPLLVFRFSPKKFATFDLIVIRIHNKLICYAASSWYRRRPDGSTLIKPTAQILKCKSKQARQRPLTVLLGIFLKSCRYIFYIPVFLTCSRTAGEIYQYFFVNIVFRHFKVMSSTAVEKIVSKIKSHYLKYCLIFKSFGYNFA